MSETSFHNFHIEQRPRNVPKRAASKFRVVLTPPLLLASLQSGLWWFGSLEKPFTTKVKLWCEVLLNNVFYFPGFEQKYQF